MHTHIHTKHIVVQERTAWSKVARIQPCPLKGNGNLTEALNARCGVGQQSVRWNSWGSKRARAHTHTDRKHKQTAGADKAVLHCLRVGLQAAPLCCLFLRGETLRKKLKEAAPPECPVSGHASLSLDCYHSKSLGVSPIKTGARNALGRHLCFIGGCCQGLQVWGI